MLDKYKVIVRPIITEKAENLRTTHNQYTFEVAPKANKSEIKKAVEQIFKVKVEKVRVMNYDGKPKRMGVFIGRRAHYKKAIVTLKEGEKIELLER
ncbi:MAG: 50S ribosomal protein L23 [candidate division WOR-3 bacterium]|nr:50S ribosomal protein L23 [candidate division WOR-3 bacterium]